jgi:hypothetical protein
MYVAVDLGHPSNGASATDTNINVYDELSTLCRLHDAGSVTEHEFASRHVELLNALDCWLSPKAGLLVSGDDPYAVQRTASW